MVSIPTIRFNIHKFYVLYTEAIFVFYIDLGTHSDYFLLKH